MAVAWGVLVISIWLPSDQLSFMLYLAKYTPPVRMLSSVNSGWLRRSSSAKFDSDFWMAHQPCWITLWSMGTGVLLPAYVAWTLNAVGRPVPGPPALG